MSERMTSVQLEGHAGGDGWADYGLKTPAEMIATLRNHAKRNLSVAEAILTAPDSAFTVETYVGVIVTRNRKILQQGVRHESPTPSDTLHAENERLREALTEAIDLAWIPDSRQVGFDHTVIFGLGYDFDGLDGAGRSEFLGEYECIVWPGRKWSAYCTYEGSMWFEKFDTEAEAKEACMKLLDAVIPDHPAMKVRAALSPEAS